MNTFLSEHAACQQLNLNRGTVERWRLQGLILPASIRTVKGKTFRMYSIKDLVKQIKKIAPDKIYAKQ